MAKRKMKNPPANVEKIPKDTPPNTVNQIPEKIFKPSGSKDFAGGEEAAFDWQSTKRNLPERFAFIYNTELYADVHFIVGRGQKQRRIPAHKLVLSVGSTVFGAMFGDNWASANEIEIPDVEADAFLILLKFLYSDVVELSTDTVMTALYAAKKYCVRVLEMSCVDFLTANLSVSNVFTILTQAQFFDELELVEKCLKIIDKDTKRAVETDDFLSIDLNTLYSILKRDTIEISEYDLLNATLRWSEAECTRNDLPINSENQQSMLKEALRHIRFPLMTQAQFSSGVAETNLLPPDDIISMFVYFTNRIAPPSKFNATPRRASYLVVNRFSELSNKVFPCSGEQHTFNFLSEHALKLWGIGMYCASKGPSNYFVKLIVEDTKNYYTIIEKSWESKNFSSNSGKGHNTFRLFLDSPVPLIRDKKYSFHISIKGPDSLCGVHTSTTCTAKLAVEVGELYEELNFLFIDTKCGPNAVKYGQLPELLMGR